MENYYYLIFIIIIVIKEIYLAINYLYHYLLIIRKLFIEEKSRVIV